ncbi:MAG: hypothetical protein K8H88_31305 [Sandaracinaceae bacterium]|nr:hypothetical protein [Sandaracinaceae bacterium]
MTVRSRLALLAWMLASVLASTLAGCPGPGSNDGGPDVYVEPELEIGTGEGVFTPFEDGTTLSIVPGTQGAQHIWIAVRTRGLAAQANLIDLVLTRDRDAAQVSDPYTVRVSLVPMGDHAEFVGLTLIVPDPAQAIGEDLTLRATVTDRDGRSVAGERHIRADWAPGEL